MSPETTYQMYLALRLHFTTKYDYFKYNGKTKADLSTVQYRRDKWNFVKLGKKYDDNFQDFMVACLVAADPIQWSGDLVSDVAERNFKEWVRRRDSFTYILKEECAIIAQFLYDEGEDFNSLMTPEGGQHPALLKLFFQKKISIETLLTFASVFGFIPLWDREIEDDIIWPDVAFKLRKYRPFMVFDKPKIKKIMLEAFE